MIERLGCSSLSFKANEIKSARDMYSDILNKNSKVAQQQNQICYSCAMMPNNQVNAQIAMQGQAQKLDVIA